MICEQLTGEVEVGWGGGGRWLIKESSGVDKWKALSTRQYSGE